jgi:hypothetical protein
MHAMRTGPTASLILSTLAGCLAACALHEPPLPEALIDPDATFVAHAVHGGYVVDRSGEVPLTRVDARGVLGRSGPTFVVRGEEGAIAGIWLEATAFTVARQGLRDTAPLMVEARPGWSNQAVRFAVATDAGHFWLGPFERVSAGAGMTMLSRTAQTNLDVRGVYRATIVDMKGTPRGWFEVRVPSPDTPRVFQGRLPEASPAFGPSLMVALGSELDWIDLHVIDVYRGIGGGRGRGAAPTR